MNWKQKIAVHFVRPMLERLGTIAATYLVAVGATEAQIGDIVAGLTAAAFLAVDLLTARHNRKLIAREGD